MSKPAFEQRSQGPEEHDSNTDAGDQPGRVVTRIKFIGSQVAMRCLQEGLDIDAITYPGKRRLSGIVGDTLAQHAQADIFQDESLHIVPAGQEYGLGIVYGQIGDAFDASDSTRHRRALRYQWELVDKASKRSEKYPEIALAEELESSWLDDNKDKAAEAVSALIASYEVRIETLVGGLAQQAAVRTAQHTAQTSLHERRNGRAEDGYYRP
ncbi:MAG TPA: hypothetical protein VF572_04620 [Candidatus Saccharimonadales bacterium]|jgi:hypothetical protein